jgi:hypothetical protein
MLKRVRWATFGYLVGIASSYAVFRRMQRIVRRYAPVEVVQRAGDGAQQKRRDVHAAVVEGRHAMRTREAELRAEVGRRWQ